MATWVTVILEIIKISVPALIVFFTVQTLLKQYLEKQYQMRLLDRQEGHQKISTPIRLQAYERLAMLCERIDLPNLLSRLRTQEGTAAGLQISMVMAVQQEFEHNVSQQIYVSDQLWQILNFAKTDTITLINGLGEKVDPKAPAKELAGTIVTFIQQQEHSAINTARAAIRKEAGLLL
ncbi:MAG: hypothetical protein KDC34_19755 [Saprospiraceae bacterium]|nr:hypothetical protein [Saprospiraceae bacterium]